MAIGNTKVNGGFYTITILKDNKVIISEDSRTNSKLFRQVTYRCDEGGTFTVKIYAEDSAGNKAEWTDQITI